MSTASRILLSGVALALAFAAAQAQTQPAAATAPAASPNATATAAVPGPGPTEVVQTAAQGMLGDLDKDRAAYRRDPAKVGQLVDKYLLPHFDTEYSARLVLGKYWRTATPEQRQRFINAFYHSLLTNYGSALAEFTADRLKIYPSAVEPAKPTATVRTEVKRDNGDRVAVNYYMHQTPQGWKAWDVVIDGISYVNSYRTDFGEQIEQQGIDAVIKRLESGEKPEAIGKTSGKS
ncbi:MAG: ABC transporter substrate-binding protein [Gammaproteobacteria bacterium]|nr:ABC transporter substrate-binding protein [Gammaproteobacteria bacterium]MBV8404143.1 ABC transporter substrate-binding protein [Gammaproteobacteria bacterium]